MSISAPRDGNRVPVIMVTSNVDGKTPILVKIDSTHTILANDSLTGSGFSYKNAQRDDNRIPVLWGISDADGVSVIPIYGDPATNEILIRSN